MSMMERLEALERKEKLFFDVAEKQKALTVGAVRELEGQIAELKSRVEKLEKRGE